MTNKPSTSINKGSGARTTPHTSTSRNNGARKPPQRPHLPPKK